MHTICDHHIYVMSLWWFGKSYSSHPLLPIFAVSRYPHIGSSKKPDQRLIFFTVNPQVLPV